MNNINHRKCAKVMIQCIVCASIQDDNPQALASRLSVAQTQKTYNNFLIAPTCITVKGGFMMNPVFLFLIFTDLSNRFKILNVNVIIKSVARFKICF